MSTREPKGIRETIRDATRRAAREAAGESTRDGDRGEARDPGQGEPLRDEGLREAIRHVYGPRAVREPLDPPSPPPAPPDPAAIPLAAAREGLRSTVRANRRFRALTIGGFAVALGLSATGLWWVAITAFG